MTDQPGNQTGQISHIFVQMPHCWFVISTTASMTIPKHVEGLTNLRDFC